MLDKSDLKQRVNQDASASSPKFTQEMLTAYVDSKGSSSFQIEGASLEKLNEHIKQYKIDSMELASFISSLAAKSCKYFDCLRSECHIYEEFIEQMLNILKQNSNAKPDDVNKIISVSLALININDLKVIDLLNIHTKLSDEQLNPLTSESFGDKIKLVCHNFHNVEVLMKSKVSIFNHYIKANLKNIIRQIKPSDLDAIELKRLFQIGVDCESSLAKTIEQAVDDAKKHTIHVTPSPTTRSGEILGI